MNVYSVAVKLGQKATRMPTMYHTIENVGIFSLGSKLTRGSRKKQGRKV